MAGTLAPGAPRKVGLDPQRIDVLIPHRTEPHLDLIQTEEDAENFAKFLRRRNEREANVYLAEDCFGRNGCVWREADSKATDLETVIADLMSGQYHDPRRVIAFNTAERWSGDVSGDVAREIQRRADLAAEDVSSTIEAFVQRYAGPNRQMSLRLA